MCHGPRRGHPAAVLVSHYRPGGLWASSQRSAGPGLQREESCPGPGPSQGSPGRQGSTLPPCLPLTLLFLRATRLRGVHHGQKETPAKDP